AELSTFFRLSQEIRNWEPPRHVCCTLLIVSDRLMPINSIFGGIRFSGNLQNFMVSMASWTWDFHHLPSRLNQPRAKLYCSEISKKLFPNYHDRRTTIRTCSNIVVRPHKILQDKTFYFAASSTSAEFWRNRFKIGKPWKGIAFVASTGKLNVLIRLMFLLG
ncbi:hypothetical protein T08_16537, partial [Trichinella sp. T8]